MDKQLAVFTIGPVQSFIASARSPVDLWSGSYLLSYLIGEAMDELTKQYGRETKIIFPVKTSGDMPRDIAALPNRITLTINGSEDRAAEILSQLERHVKSVFSSYCHERIADYFQDDLHQSDFSEINERAESQINGFLEVYWATASCTNDKFFRVREKVEKSIAAIKNDKKFHAMEDEGATCTVCGRRSALSSHREMWRSHKIDGIPLKDNERLCAICLTKRMSREHFRKFYKDRGLIKNNEFYHFDSHVHLGGRNYFGILLMDGDNMGAFFSKGSDEGSYRETSEKLTRYAEKVSSAIHKRKGRLIYAGGDDVFALLPIGQLLPTAVDLRAAFQSEIGEKASTSAGIVIGHNKAPLDELIQDVRQMEGKAKGYKFGDKEKNAVAIRVRPHSGNMIESVIPWTIERESSYSVELLNKLVELLSDEKLSKSFIYHLSDSFKPMLSMEKKDLFQGSDEPFFAEFKRLAVRSIFFGKNKEEIEHSLEVIDQIRPLYRVESGEDGKLERFIDLMKIAAFFHRKDKEERKHDKAVS